jgi:hypothetical protein
VDRSAKPPTTVEWNIMLRDHAAAQLALTKELEPVLGFLLDQIAHPYCVIGTSSYMGKTQEGIRYITRLTCKTTAVKYLLYHALHATRTSRIGVMTSVRHLGMVELEHPEPKGKRNAGKRR